MMTAPSFFIQNSFLFCNIFPVHFNYFNNNNKQAFLFKNSYLRTEEDIPLTLES